MDGTGISLGKLVLMLFQAIVAMLVGAFGYQHNRIGKLESALKQESHDRQAAKDSVAVELSGLRRDIANDVNRLHEKIDANQNQIMSYLMERRQV